MDEYGVDMDGNSLEARWGLKASNLPDTNIDIDVSGSLNHPFFHGVGIPSKLGYNLNVLMEMTLPEKEPKPKNAEELIAKRKKAKSSFGDGAMRKRDRNSHKK